ncbi:hypothetical protein GR925_01365 [Streptomyces sp. HUCO-GS316]|uniref:hypothetical protein n=1 Tax=Streptomyces sp. HUCO-GS316 TaxID=2692198 RepID=UPI00136896BE|nr:hypothetical protein [Streptomyces sp. HUCO-GS316]MXM62133.1 hypothetical protein [Streptomyces sp. HUCO-GS316]
MSWPLDEIPVRFAWPDEQAPLARVLPVILHADGFQRIVAPGEAVLLPSTRVTAVAVVPGSVPLVAELDCAAGDLLVLPFPTDAVAAAVVHRQDTQRRTVAFGVDVWSGNPPGPTETGELTIDLGGAELRLASRPGEDQASVAARLVLAARTTPTRVIAVPPLGPDETAVVDLTAERPFGDRPALVPSDPCTRLLLAYLGSGQYQIARALAARLTTVLGEQRPVAWSEPSFAQLLVGYSLAADEDGPALAAWCRRTRADRLLGADGLVLASTAAWQERKPRDAARLLLRAGQAGTPVMSLGLEFAVRLAYRLLARGLEREALDRLVTAYSVLSTTSDPLAETVTTPTSPRRPVSLQGRGWLARLHWALAYLAVRARLPHAVRSAAEGVPVVLKPSSPLHRGVNMNPRSLRQLAFALVVAWLAVVAAVVVVAVSDTGDWERLVAPLGILEAAVFTLLGVAIGNAPREVWNGREKELLTRVAQSEKRVREVEEEAMKGRALAAALQAESGPEASSDVIRHARLSQCLFNDLLGEQFTVSGDGEP